LSVCEALTHAAASHGAAVDLAWVSAEDVETQGPEALLADADGILVPGGFGSRGVEGKIAAIRWARERGVPYLGLCLGMQLAVVETARHVAGLERAHSREFDPNTPHPVIDLMPDQQGLDAMGGTMRLGRSECRARPDSLTAKLYGSTVFYERHRHRYEVNPAYWQLLEQAGIVIAATSADGQRVEVIERPDHPFFVASQFHPEWRSRPNRPHPLFSGFVGAALSRRRVPVGNPVE
ncbi:MAG TPA: gamma-glutamyl-gamma-aminobutyrate hydrolase family protein, partial [Limnochordales bacterium]